MEQRTPTPTTVGVLLFLLAGTGLLLLPLEGAVAQTPQVDPRVTCDPVTIVVPGTVPHPMERSTTCTVEHGLPSIVRFEVVCPSGDGATYEVECRPERFDVPPGQPASFDIVVLLFVGRLLEGSRALPVTIEATHVNGVPLLVGQQHPKSVSVMLEVGQFAALQLDVRTSVHHWTAHDDLVLEYLVTNAGNARDRFDVSVVNAAALRAKGIAVVSHDSIEVGTQETGTARVVLRADRAAWRLPADVAVAVSVISNFSLHGDESPEERTVAVRVRVGGEVAGVWLSMTTVRVSTVAAALAVAVLMAMVVAKRRRWQQASGPEAASGAGLMAEQRHVRRDEPARGGGTATARAGDHAHLRRDSGVQGRRDARRLGRSPRG